MKRKSENTLNSNCSKTYLLVSIFSIISFLGFAQDTTDVDYSYHFKVRNPKMEIIVEQRDSVMYTDHENKLRITVTGKNKLGAVVLDGGEISRIGNSFIATVKEGTESVLVVYVAKPNGKMELGLTKKYPIVHLSDPMPIIAGVKHDSIIVRANLLEADFLYATMTRFNKTTRIKILSFEMTVFRDTTEVNYKSTGDRFSPEMRRYVQVLQPGIPLNFTQIICLMPNGKPRRLEDMRVFVDCSNKYRFAE
jgi:GldM C-terminal domain